jgi:L-alanine-DL-glutamate epimerase-like enolase superfamily enzyme
LAADESAQTSADLRDLQGRYSIINIKLDKCGGLTAALSMATLAIDYGFRVMVGNMGGTSLAMAPAFLLGQLSEIVDLDGPYFLELDRQPSSVYSNGYLDCPRGIWGAA